MLDAASAERPSSRPRAVLDNARVGDIEGAFGAIREGDLRPRMSWAAKLRTLAAVVGPGLIVPA